MLRQPLSHAIAGLALASLFGFASALAHAQAADSDAGRAPTFDFDRYEALDANVLASDGALGLHERLSGPWQVAAGLAIAARAELLTYIQANIDDPALDADTRAALVQVRATLALDVVVLGLDVGDCDIAQRWIDWSAGVVDEASVERLAVARERVTSECSAPNPDVAAAPSSAEAAEAAEHSLGQAVVPEPVAASESHLSFDEAQARPSRGAGWALVGTGAALGLGTVIVDVTGAADRDLLDELDCGSATGCIQADLDRYNEARHRKNGRSAAMAAMLVGAVGAGTTGLVLLTRRGGHDEGAHTAAPRLQVRTTGTALSATLRF